MVYNNQEIFKIKTLYHYVDNGRIYRRILENIIHFKYSKQMINYCIKGSPILDQTLGQNLTRLGHSCCRILSLSMRENIASIFSDIWKKSKNRRFPLVNFGYNRKKEALLLPVFLNPKRALYKQVQCSRKRDRSL